MKTYCPRCIFHYYVTRHGRCPVCEAVLLGPSQPDLDERKAASSRSAPWRVDLELPVVQQFFPKYTQQQSDALLDELGPWHSHEQLRTLLRQMAGGVEEPKLPKRNAIKLFKRSHTTRKKDRK